MEPSDYDKIPLCKCTVNQVIVLRYNVNSRTDRSISNKSMVQILACATKKNFTVVTEHERSLVYEVPRLESNTKAHQFNLDFHNTCIYNPF
jgi:hypothetical protein